MPDDKPPLIDLNDFVTPPEPRHERPLSSLDRGLGCGCGFVPAGLFGLVATIGFWMGDRAPDAPPIAGGDFKMLLVLGSAGLGGALGAVWLGGRPRRMNGGALVVLGLVVFAVGANRVVMVREAVNPLGLALLASALVVIAAAYVGDRRSS